MRKRAYDAKCKKLFKKAEQKGLKLDFSPQNFDHHRLNCLWYGGYIAKVQVTSSLAILIEANGDIRATLFDKHENELCFVKDKMNSGRFCDEMAYYIKNDSQLAKLLDSGRLVLDNNNWIEFNGIVSDANAEKGEKFVDLYMITDNILDDNILCAIEQVLDSASEITEDIVYSLEEK